VKLIYFPVAFSFSLGNFIAVAFVFICLLDVPQVTWYVGNFITTQYLTEIPMYVINAVTIITLTIALLYGIEAIARSAEIFIYIMSFMIILTLVMVCPNADVRNILPVLEKGMTPVLKGSILLSSYTTWPIIVLNMVYPLHTGNIKSPYKPLLLGYLWASAIIFICNIMSILVLGSNVAAQEQFPTYMLAKEINLGTIFTRFEAIIAGAWIISLFFKAALYFYGAVMGISQVLGLKDYKKIVLPLGLISIVFSDIVYPNGNYEAQWDSTTWIVWIATFAVILPMVILSITAIKKCAGHKHT
jgi:spore germination protein KB